VSEVPLQGATFGVKGFGGKVWGVGFWVSGLWCMRSGFWVLRLLCMASGSGFWVWYFWSSYTGLYPQKCRVSPSSCPGRGHLWMVWGLGCMVYGGIKGLGSWAPGSGSRVPYPGLRVSGLGVRVRVLFAESCVRGRGAPASS